MHFLAFSKNEFFHEEARGSRALLQSSIITMINHVKQKLVTGVIPNKSKLTWFHQQHPPPQKKKEKRKNQHPQTIFNSNTHQYLLNFDHLIINHLAFETKLGSITLIFGRNQTLPPVFAKLLLPLNSILAKGSYPLVPIVFRHTLVPHFDM